MLEGTTRISPIDAETCPDDLRETLKEQGKLWGEPLYPCLFYARSPPLRANNVETSPPPGV